MTRVWLLVLGVFATIGFASVVLVLLPRALLMQVEPNPGIAPYSLTELRGRGLYIANGCYYCHSQQVRDAAFTTDVARGWGARPTLPGDYPYDRPHLLGTMRTGPDLLNVAGRLPDPEWHLLHLYQPRAVVPWSIMPAYPFLFREVAPEAVNEGDVVLRIPPDHAPEGRSVIATADALALVDYLLTLDRDAPLPEPAAAPEAEAAPAVSRGLR